jgi:hypothetical protein
VDRPDRQTTGTGACSAVCADGAVIEPSATNDAAGIRAPFQTPAAIAPRTCGCRARDMHELEVPMALFEFPKCVCGGLHSHYAIPRDLTTARPVTRRDAGSGVYSRTTRVVTTCALGSYA